MTATTRISARDQIPALLRGESKPISEWTQNWNTHRVMVNLAVIVVGSGLYGAAMGCWRAPEQALFVAIKFPLIILLTAIGNFALNGMLAPLLGLNISLRQSFLAILTSFTIVATILGAFSPLTAFIVWNIPPMSTEAMPWGAYGFIKLTHVLVIAFAGIAGNARLYQLLVQLGGRPAVGRNVLIAWLAVNLFLGSQLSWILRPFIGAPHLPVVFLRDTAFQGNFYENVFHTFTSFFSLD